MDRRPECLSYCWAGPDLNQFLSILCLLGLLATAGSAQPTEVREVVEVTKDQAVFRNGPDGDFDRYTPVAAGVRFEILGRQGDWLHVSPPDAYIQQKDVKVLPPGSALWPSKVHVVKIKESPDGATEVRVRLYHPCAWQIQEDPELGRIFVDFPGVPMKMHEMAFAQDARRVPSARLHASPQGTQLELVVANGIWGYQASWDHDDLVLRLPAPVGELRGLKVTLDAGHGGSDAGAPGIEGHFEKNYNLAVTAALKKELEEAGAIVTMTRETDVDVNPLGAAATQEQELGTRVQIAEKSGSQLFVSIHHNAMADLEAGRKAHGCHIYYYHPHSRAMAQAIAKPLADSIGESSSMHLWRSFFVTRQAGMPAILIECNFVSNPQLEKDMLMQPDYPTKAAQGIRQGLEDYLKAAKK